MMAAHEKPVLANLETRLGYHFSDASLASQALTHVTAPQANAADRPQSYQRLEFLGDRVLGLAVAAMLYDSYPNASEGEMSIRLAKLVRRETCAEVAREWDLGGHIVMGQGEARAGGRKKQAILADVCEALIGAAFLDGGYLSACQMVQQAWRGRMEASADPERDAKTAMQEWAQGRGLPAPVYNEIERSGPAHAPHFVMGVDLPGYASEQGAASSKRAAEQAAARAFLNRWNP